MLLIAMAAGAAAADGRPRARPSGPVEFVTIPGGTFMMGTKEGLHDNEPVHAVAIETFEMSKTAVTAGQYAECVGLGRCSEPGTFKGCTSGIKGRERHPVTCVTWTQAAEYAAFRGARLPSEAQWEYAAKSAGKRRKYPWGDQAPTCRTAVMDDGGAGCGAGGPLPVCSKPAGNTEQGLCDMSGNVWEWVQDAYGRDYTGAPADGSPFEGPSASGLRAMRGGSFRIKDPAPLRADYRTRARPTSRAANLGFRLARPKAP